MKLNRILSTILSAIISITLLSGCEKSESITEGTTVSEVTAATVTSTTTTVPETALEITTEPTTTPIATSETTPETTRELTAEELEIMDEMPEIVFVYSHYIYAEQNICGFFVTRDGNVKMYDFRNEEESINDVLKVIDRLEAVTCSELESYTTIKAEELKCIPQHKMVEYYNTLLQIDKKSEVIVLERHTDDFEGIGKFYGIRHNKNNETEIITLTGWGYFYDVNTDPLAEQIAIYNVLKDIPYKLYY